MVGDSETETFWSEFLHSLRERGLSGVRLVISDSHSGLVEAIREVMIGAGWQRCRVHFVRNVFFGRRSCGWSRRPSPRTPSG